MNTAKVIGIIGGMGPQAGIELHKRIVCFSEANYDQAHFSIIHICFPSKVVDRTQYLENKIDVNPAHAILEMITTASIAGATVLGIACNTAHSHQIFQPIKTGLTKLNTAIHLVNMVEEACEYCRQLMPSNSKIGILATNGVYASKLYLDALEQTGFEVVVPSNKLQDEVIHNMIYNIEFGLKSSSTVIHPEVLELLKKAMDFYLENDVQTIILGCTEFSLLKQVITTNFPNTLIVDTMDILAKALIREASKQATD